MFVYTRQLLKGNCGIIRLEEDKWPCIYKHHSLHAHNIDRNSHQWDSQKREYSIKVHQKSYNVNKDKKHFFCFLPTLTNLEIAPFDCF